MKKHLIFFIILFSYQSSICQRIVSDLELYYLSYIFKNAEKLNISELLEKDKNSETTRRWEFNSDGQILKEIDFRESIFSMSFGKNMIDESKTSQKGYFYEYDENGGLIKILEKTIFNDELLEVEHIIHDKGNILTEEYEIRDDKIGRMTFKNTTKFLDGKIDTIFHKTSYLVGENIMESVLKSIYEYNMQGKLKSKMSFYRINVKPKSIEGIEEKEIKSSKSIYKYDQANNLKELIKYEFNDAGNTGFNRKISFHYNKNEVKPNEIHAQFNESYSPQFLNYVITYKSDGVIKEVKVDDEKLFYEIKKRK